MTSIKYAARLTDPFGTHIHTFSNFIDPSDGGGAGMDYVLNVGKPAALLLTVPMDTPLSWLAKDNRIYPMRSINSGRYYNDNNACYFIRKRTMNAGRGWIRVTAYHANELLDRRGVLYPSNGAFTTKTAMRAGNMIKAFVRENIGASVSSTRDGDDTYANLVTPGYLVIESDKNDGVVITEKLSDRGSLLGLIQDISDLSATQGTYIAFNIIATTTGTFLFTTKQTCWGTDRRSGTSEPFTLSELKGNIENIVVTEDASNEVTVAAAGGRGQDDERLVGVYMDTARAAETPFNRRERFYDAPNAETQDAVDAAALAYAEKGRPIVTAEGDLVEHARATRGVHYDLGDLVTFETRIQGQPYAFESRLDTIYISVRAGSNATRVQLRSPA